MGAVNGLLRARRANAGRWVTPEALNVAPALLGRPLAQPARRLLAMAVDLAAIGIISSLLNAWLLAACALGAFEEARAQRIAPSLTRTVLVWGLAALMAATGLYGMVDDLLRDRPARSASADDDEADDERPGAEKGLSAAALARMVAASEPADAASMAATVTVLHNEVRRLKRQLARERDAAEEAAAAEHWRERLRRLGLEFGIGYGWALVYFTMLPVWWHGQTLGKRWFGLRTLEITGRPMTPMLAFKRFSGYLAGLATGGLGLLQLLWDPNRQALQDKAAHTVVIDERRPPRPEALPTLPEPTDADPAPAPELTTADPAPPTTA